MARVETPAARLENVVAPSAPKRGKRGQERPRQVTEQDSATRQTAPGVMHGENGHARVASTPQVLVPAAACGHGQDSGPVAPRGEGANAAVPASGLPAADVAGPRVRADSHDPSDGNVEQWAGEQLEASRPAPPCRARAPRVATPGRHQPQTAAALTRADCTDDHAQAWYPGPAGNVFTLAARRPTLGHHSDRRYAADEADGHACPLRATC
jgi:hypothetical protein